MKSVLVLSASNLKNDPRVHRQLIILVREYAVTAIGLASPEIDNVRFLPMVMQTSLSKKIKAALLLLLRQFDSYYWSRSFVESSMNAVAGQYFDIIIANDLLMLPLAIKIAKGKSRVIFDAHEYAPKEFEDRWTWRLFFQKFNHYLCKSYLSKVHGMMTVCQGIADEYKLQYHVNPVVLTNAPPYQNLQPSPLKPGLIRMIHHGGAIPSRHLEIMIEMMAFLDERFRLDFMLMPSNPKYFDQLKKLALGDPRIRFVDPVEMQSIPKVCNQYDIGIYLLPPVNFNHMHALPNKIFEFIQARLVVAVGPSPEMQRLVEYYNCGVVADDFSPQALANSLAGLTEDRIQYFKQQAHQAATEQCAEQNAQKIIDVVEGY